RPVEQQHAARGDRDRDRIVDVDRAHEVALLALVPQPARRAPFVHREPAPVERAAAAAWAAEPERAADDAPDAAGREGARPSRRARCATVRQETTLAAAARRVDAACGVATPIS